LEDLFSSGYLTSYKVVFAAKAELSQEIQTMLAQDLSLADAKISACLAAC
jgi:hypothetical protein